MRPSYVDLKNQKFGRLTALEDVGRTKSGAAIWRCLCHCGNIKNIRGYHLRLKKILSCGCLKRETVNIKWPECGEIGRWLWNNYRCSAKRRGLEFNLTVQDMWELALKQDKKCALSGESLIFFIDPKRKVEANASLDRMDSTKGYVIDNVQWVTKKMNHIKGSMTQEDFVRMCGSVYNHVKNKNG